MALLFCAFPAYKAMDEEKYQNCTSDEREKGSKPCLYDLSTLGECYSTVADFKYGYDEGKPCIFFKMNRVGCFLKADLVIGHLVVHVLKKCNLFVLTL